MIRHLISFLILLIDIFGETSAIDLNYLKRKEQDCFRLAPSSLSPDQKNALCANGKYGSHPAECGINVISEAKYILQLKHVTDFCATEKGNADTGKCFGSVYHRSDLSLAAKARVCTKAGANILLVARCINTLQLPSNTNELLYETLCTGIGAASADCLNTFLTSPVISSLQNHIPIATQICHDANSTAPVANCLLDHRIKHIPIDQQADLCRGAKDDGPVLCFLRSPTRLLNDTSIIELCKASQSRSPAVCADDLSPKIAHKLKSEGIISLCRGAPSDVSWDGQNGPSTCAKALPPGVPAAIIIETCKGANGNKPAKCFMESADNLRNETLQAKLCVGVEDNHNIQKCLNTVPYTLPISTKVDFCSRAVDEKQIICARNIWSGNIKNNCHIIQNVKCDMDADLLLSLCLNTNDATKTSQCFLQAVNILSIRQAFELCTGDIPNEQIAERQNEGSGSFSKSRGNQNQTRSKLHQLIKHEFISPPVECVAFGIDVGLDTQLVVPLCDGSNGEGPIRCALSVPFSGHSSNDENIITLCKYARDTGPSNCASEVAAMSFTPQQRSIACHGTTSDTFKAPIQCMLMNSNKDIDRNQLAHLCATSENLTPGYCAKTLNVLTESNIQLCRSAVSNPTTAKIDTIQSNLPAKLNAGEEFTILVGIRDQFDQLRVWDNDTLIHADVVGADNAGSRTLMEQTKNSRFLSQAQNGLASFSFSLDDPGLYSLYICIINKDEISVPSDIDHVPCLDYSSDRAQVRISPKE
mmetsp:Transcript_33985/g.49244  ORF Transcript_33985/g.49244 Transcript_33985/m.49244 type:complete len:758 (-) Transcript_33985:226-2499(-)